MKLPYDPAIPLLGIYFEKTMIEKTHVNPLHCSCLKSPMGRVDLWATVCGVAEADTTEHLSTHACTPASLGAPFTTARTWKQPRCPLTGMGKKDVGLNNNGILLRYKMEQV